MWFLRIYIYLIKILGDLDFCINKRKLDLYKMRGNIKIAWFICMFFLDTDPLYRHFMFKVNILNTDDNETVTEPMA